MPLIEVTPDLWIANAAQTFFGLELGARMTVLRLADGRLLLHSPIGASPELVAAVARLGDVGFIVAPNRFHHLYVAPWQAAFPSAATWLAPGLAKKRPDLACAGEFSDDAAVGSAPELGESLSTIVVHGLPMLSEVAFFHHPSRSLLLCDLAINIDHTCPALTRAVTRMLGSYGSLSPTLLDRMLVRDRQALRTSMQQLFDWPFERVVVSHGKIAGPEGRAQLTAGYAWLMS